MNLESHGFTDQNKKTAVGGGMVGELQNQVNSYYFIQRFKTQIFIRSETFYH